MQEFARQSLKSCQKQSGAFEAFNNVSCLVIFVVHLRKRMDVQDFPLSSQYCAFLSIKKNKKSPLGYQKDV